MCLLLFSLFSNVCLFGFQNIVCFLVVVGGGGVYARVTYSEIETYCVDPTRFQSCMLAIASEPFMQRALRDGKRVFQMRVKELNKHKYM